MMFLLAYIGAPPTIGSPAAIAPPATARATTAAALSSLNFMMRTPFLSRRGLGLPLASATNICLTGQSAVWMQRLRIQLHARPVILLNGLESSPASHDDFATWIARPLNYPLSAS